MKAPIFPTVHAPRAKGRAIRCSQAQLEANPHLQRDIGAGEWRHARPAPPATQDTAQGSPNKKPRPMWTRFSEFWWVIRDLNS